MAGYSIWVPGIRYPQVILGYFRVGELQEKQDKKDPPAHFYCIFVYQLFKKASDLKKI